MLQQDMTGYVGANKKDQMGLIVDNVDDALTNFIRLVLDAVSCAPGSLWLPGPFYTILMKNVSTYHG